MNIKGFRWCPLTPEEIRKSRTLLGMTQLEFSQALGTDPYQVWKWEHGYISRSAGRIKGPGKAVSLTLVELIRSIWWDDPKRLDLVAWWSKQREEATKAQQIRLKQKKIRRKRTFFWTNPLTGADGSLDCPNIQKWKPGKTKERS